MKLSTDHTRYLDGLWRDMREAVRQYRKFDAQWVELNEALKTKLDQEGVHDPLMRANTMNANIELAGYLSGGQWWREKATMLSSVIQAEKAALEMLRGGVGWEPASPLPRSR